MTNGDIRVRVLVDNAEGVAGLSVRWGLSLWIETSRARVLLDCSDADAFLLNAERLGISLETADGFVLSHGHYDHGGGIEQLAEIAPSTPLFLHPGALLPRYSLRENGKAEAVGLPDHSLAAVGAASRRVFWTVKPLEVAPGIWVTGPVPRYHPLEHAEKTLFLDTACTIPDCVVDDQAVWIETPSGLVVLCGCAHSGVVNTVQYIRLAVAARVQGPTDSGGRTDQSTPMSDDGLPVVRGLVGGLHLFAASNARLQATADYLGMLDLELCAPCHCTGQRAKAVLGERLPRAFLAVATGSELKLASPC
jgi:7,8-dihydropterin-6-yl-methyl-4-(beta-D-ribofuranosyl)aminobenzene 5'-phosphate synthase